MNNLLGDLLKIIFGCPAHRTHFRGLDALVNMTAYRANPPFHHSSITVGSSLENQ
jgi:hypothetical protein